MRISDWSSDVSSSDLHWGSRWGADRNRALWSSFVIETPEGNIFFGGDTGGGDMKWREEAASYGPVSLAIIPIGAFRSYAGQVASGNNTGPRGAGKIIGGRTVSEAEEGEEGKQGE